MPLLAAALIVTTLATGCEYYEVNDPNTNKTYYTHNWNHKKYKATGAIEFKDEATGKTVTLTNHEIRKINEKKWNAGVNRQFDLDE